jgi:hypothetical protein
MPDKIITVAVAANPNNWQVGWHGSYDYANLAMHSDYLLIMGYDESYYGGPAGPVASIEFAEKSIIQALKFTTPEKIVLGVPFFGRYWKDGESIGGNGLTNMDVENLLKNYNATTKYYDDKKSAQVFLTLSENEEMPKLWGGRVLTPGTYEIWYDDTNSTMSKLELVNKYNLKGSGSWALGQDINDVWNQYSEYKDVDIEVPNIETPDIEVPDIEIPDIEVPDIETPDSENTNLNTTIRTWRSEEKYDENNMLIKEEIITITTKSNKKSTSSNVINDNASDESITKNESGIEDSIKIQRSQPRATSLDIYNGEDVNLIENSVISHGWISKEEYKADSLVSKSGAIKTIMRMGITLPYPEIEVESFEDTVNHEDEIFILKAKYYGVIPDIETNTFSPDEKITKEELVTYLDRVFNLPNTVNFESTQIKDVVKKDNPESYYAINKFLEHEIVDIDGEGNFYPDSYVTMGDMAKTIYKLSGIGVKNLTPVTENVEQTEIIISPR